MKLTKIFGYTTLAACLAFVPVRMVRAQTGTGTDAVAAVTQLENDAVKADLSGDKAFSEKYLASDWIGCDSSGTWFTKADVLKMLADPQKNKYNSEKISDVKVRVYGNAAIATYSDTYDAVVNGEHRSRTILDTDVWVKTGGTWKQVSSHATTKK
jgi:hypothetical protein